ncbi:MAG: amidohydrolase [Oscillospiraceae bacterium]
MLFKNITVVGENYEVFKNANLLVEGEKIIYIGNEMPKDYEGEIFDGENKIAMPGYYNLHSHVPMTLIRGYGEGLPLKRWLEERMFPFEDLMSADDMYWGSMLGIAEMLASGAVSFNDMYMETQAITKSVEETGIKANIARACTSFSDDVHFQDVDEWEAIHFLQDYMKNSSSNRIIGECSIHAEYTSKETLVREVAEYSAKNGLNMHIHLSETQNEHKECKTRHMGMTPTEWFDYCGVFNSPTIAAHCVCVEERDMEILAKHKVTVAHCPSSNLKLGSGIAPIKEMIEKGIRVGIGTDGAASNNNLNMHEEVNLASILHKGVNKNSEDFGPQKMLKMACEDAAAAQGRNDCGVLKVGNKADIVVFDLNKPHLCPVYDALATIMYSANASDICLTMVDGKVLYKNGVYTTIDIEKVLFNANRIRDEKLAILNKR